MTATDPGILIRSADIDIGVGVPQEAEVKSWVAQQIPYDNLVGKNESMDRDVDAYVEGLRSTFKQRMAAIYDRWATNWFTANGNSVASEYEDDVHVPETSKMLNGKVSRIEEALFEFDPFFEVEGVNDQIEPLVAQTIRAYIRRRLELANYRELMRPTTMDAELCQVAAIKIVWERVLEEQIERKIELRQRKDGTPYYHDERRLKKVLVKEGPFLYQVDPSRLLIDLDATCEEDCGFLGDESDQFRHALDQKADIGLYSKEQMKKVVDRSPETRDLGRLPDDMVRSARSLTMEFGKRDQQEMRNGAKRHVTLELYCWFDFKDGYDGITGPDGKQLTGLHKIVVTRVDDVIVQIRQNPFDKKFYPYGVSILNRNGHEVIATGPFDNAVIANAQYDRFQSNILRHFELSIAPIVQKGPNSDLPESLLGVKPGTVFPGTGELREIKISDIPQSVQYMHQYFRREMEELTGALRVGEGPNANTLGEAERQLQEQNRLLRSEIRAIAGMWRSVALKMFWMSAQFSSQREKFQVLGKDAEALGSFATMTPDMLQEPINIRFIGLENLHTFGSRTSGMVQWANSWAPLAMNYPEVNWLWIMQQHWERTVGKENLRDVFNVRPPKYQLMPQKTENMHLRRGLQVKVSEEDEDLQHMEEMRQDGMMKLALDPKTPQAVADAILEHYAVHQQNMQRKAAQKAADAAAQQQKQQLLAPGGGMPGVDRSPEEGGMPAMPQGVTPGPAQARTVARSGRQGSGTSQMQMMEAG